MKPAAVLKNIFCDRDGTIIYDKHYLADPDGVELLPGAAAGLARLAGAGTGNSAGTGYSTRGGIVNSAGAGLRLFLVTNQSGIGRGFFSEADYAACQSRLEELLATAGVVLTGSAHCPHAPYASSSLPEPCAAATTDPDSCAPVEQACDCRKPDIGMWRTLSAEHGLKAAESAIIGDKPEDLLFAVKAGFAAAVLVLTGKGRESAAKLNLPELDSDRGFQRLDGVNIDGVVAGSGTIFGLARDLEAAADFLLTLHWQGLAAGFSAYAGAQAVTDADPEVYGSGMEAVEAVTAAVPKAVSGGTRSDYRRIAVWNTAFLGDAVLTLPLIQTLRRAFPAAEIDFYTRKGFAPLFASHPALHAVYEYDKRSSLPAMLCFGRDLRTRGYDLFICAHPSTRSAILTRLSGAGRRIGYHLTAGTGRTGGSGGVGGTSGQPGFGRLFFTDQVDRKFGSLPEIERLLRLTLPLGLDPLDWETWPELVLPDAAEEKAARLFAELRSDCEDTARGCSHRPVLGLHPGSVWGTKRWPLEYFAEIGLRALREGAQVLLFAGPGEESMAKDVQSLILAALPSASALPRTSSSSDVPELSSSLPAYASAKDVRLLNLAGALSLPELAACLGRLDCYLTNDSGPMHLAWAKGTPVVALFGPTVRDFGFAPRGESSVVLEVAGLDCRPCGLHGPQSCPEGHHNCMRKLSPDLVWDEVRKKIMGF